MSGIASQGLIFIQSHRKQQTGSLVARRPPQETVQVDQFRAEPGSIPLSKPSASREQESLDPIPQAIKTKRLDFTGDDGMPRSITERRDDVAEHTGVEISSTVLGQGNRTGQVPFYTGITATQHLPALLFGY